MTAEKEVKKEKSPRRPFRGAAPLSVILAILLTVALLAAGMLGIVRSTLSGEGIRRIITSVNVGDILRAVVGRAPSAEAAPAPDSSSVYVRAATAGIPDGIYDILGSISEGDLDAVAEYIYDTVGEDVLEEADLDKEKLVEIIRESTVEEFVAEKLSDAAEGFIEDGELKGIDSAMLVDLLRENEPLIKKVTGKEITAEQFAKIESKITENNIKIEISAQDIKNAVGIDPTPIMKIMSPATYITAIVCAALIAVLILVLNKFLIGKTLSYLAVPSLIAGVVIGLAAAVVHLAAGSVLDGALLPVAGALNVPFVIRAASFIGFGVVALIAAVPLKKKNI